MYQDLFSGYKYSEAGQLTATTDTEYDATTALSYSARTVIRTDQTITVKLNSTSNDAIQITSAMSPYTIQDLMVLKAFITNASGSTANVKILFVGPKKSTL